MFTYRFAIDQIAKDKFIADMLWCKKVEINGVALPFGMCGNKAKRLGYFATREAAQQAVEAKKAELRARAA